MSAIVPRTYGVHWGRAVRVPHRSLEDSYFVCLAIRRNQSNLGGCLSSGMKVHVFACLLGCFTSWFQISWLASTLQRYC